MDLKIIEEDVSSKARRPHIEGERWYPHACEHRVCRKSEGFSLGQPCPHCGLCQDGIYECQKD